MKSFLDRRWWSALLLVVAAIVAFKLLGSIGTAWRLILRFLDILSPFVGGFVLAFLLYRPCCAAERLFKKCKWTVIRRPARVWAVSLVYLVLLGVLALAVWGVVPLVIEGVTGLIKSLPVYYESAIAFVREHGGEGLFALVDMQEIVDSLYTYVKEHFTVDNLLGYASGLMSITSSAASVLVAFIVSIYMLAGRESLFAGIRRVAEAFLPARITRLGSHYLHKTYDIFSRYVYSMLIDALCITVALIPGMYISGIPYPLAFAILVGVANLIPYFGAIISGALCVLVLLLSGKFGMAIFLGVYILVAQQLDSNLLQPRLHGHSVGLKPIYVLLAITVGGGIGGFVGMLICVPVTAVLKELLNDYITYRNRIKTEKVTPEEEVPQ